MLLFLIAQSGAPQSAQLSQSDAIKRRNKGQGEGSVQSAKREPSITCLQFPFNNEPSAECSRMAPECKNRKWKWKKANEIAKSKANSANDTHKSPHPPSSIPLGSCNCEYESAAVIRNRNKHRHSSISISEPNNGIHMVIYRSNNNYNIKIKKNYKQTRQSFDKSNSSFT